MRGQYPPEEVAKRLGWRLVCNHRCDNGISQTIAMPSNLVAKGHSGGKTLIKYKLGNIYVLELLVQNKWKVKRSGDARYCIRGGLSKTAYPSDVAW